MASRIVPPHLGEQVRVTDSVTEQVRDGIVEALLSTQFVYRDSEGNQRYCFYKENWESVS